MESFLDREDELEMDRIDKEERKRKRKQQEPDHEVNELACIIAILFKTACIVT